MSATIPLNVYETASIVEPLYTGLNRLEFCMPVIITVNKMNIIIMDLPMFLSMLFAVFAKGRAHVKNKTKKTII